MKMSLIFRMLALLLLSSCDYYEPKAGRQPVGDPGVPTENPEPLRPTFASLNKNFFIPLCVDCHSGAMAKGSLDLSTVDGVLSAVVPGKPEESLLYLMVEWEEMPPGGGATTEEREALRTWIREGAKAPQ